MNDTTSMKREAALDQARLLAEALPFMQRYENKTIVVKYGGAAMGDPALAQAFARDIALLKQSGVNPVVVHGGGPQIGEMLKKIGIKSEFRGGLRVTDKATVEIVEMVLAGSINKEIVALINKEGEWAIGLSGKDGNMVFAEKATRTTVDPDSKIEEVIDLGFVGEPVEVDRTLLDLLARSEMIPVIAPVAPGRDGETYNINADTFAGAIAGALSATRLLFLTDVPGVLDKSRRADRRTDGGGSEGAHCRRHHFRRHDPKGGDLHRRGRTRRRGRRHPRRQDAARGAARALYRARRRNADQRVRSRATTRGTYPSIGRNGRPASPCRSVAIVRPVRPRANAASATPARCGASLSARSANTGSICIA